MQERDIRRGGRGGRRSGQQTAVTSGAYGPALEKGLGSHPKLTVATLGSKLRSTTVVHPQGFAGKWTMLAWLAT